jgi:hypothetical protein
VRPADRNKVVHLANLYSLSVHSDAGSNLLVLTKTLKTVRLKEFGSPTASGARPVGAAAGGVEFKRRRRTPPPHSPPMDDTETSPEAVAVAASAEMEAAFEAAVISDVSMSAPPAPPAPIAASATAPLSNRSESPVLGASAGPSNKEKFSGSLSS